MENNANHRWTDFYVPVSATIIIIPRFSLARRKLCRLAVTPEILTLTSQTGEREDRRVERRNLRREILAHFHVWQTTKRFRLIQLLSRRINLFERYFERGWVGVHPL